MKVTRLTGERRPSETNVTYKLTEVERDHVAICFAIGQISRHPGRWSNTAIGKAFGIDRSRVPRIAATRVIE